MGFRAFGNWKISLIFLGLLFSILVGCSPFYLARVAYEEGKILWRRVPIEDLLEDSNVDTPKREKLRLVLNVRSYAKDELRMNVGGSYSSVSYIDRPVLSYVLMAVPKTDLTPYTWWFLVVGRVPYKGFFHEKQAQAEAGSLEARGYDTFIRPAPAFSTLGWFDDPLLHHLLDYDSVTLAEIVFHELFHNTLFVRGSVNFNESLANFVGSHAAIQFFQDHFGEDSAEHKKALRDWKEELEFSKWLADLAQSLNIIYVRSDLTEEEKLSLKARIFGLSQKGWANRIGTGSTHRYRGFSSQELNNAVLAHYLLYLKDLATFESLYKSVGGDLVTFIASVRKTIGDREDPFVAIRERVAGMQN